MKMEKNIPASESTIRTKEIRNLTVWDKDDSLKENAEAVDVTKTPAHNLGGGATKL